MQTSRIFADSKTFPDCAPKFDPLDILIRYRRRKRSAEFDLEQFVHEHFYLPQVNESFYVIQSG
ncbi:trehalase [Plautia stali symbiont]|nr:trehalase [Plautia stali symbiont]